MPLADFQDESRIDWVNLPEAWIVFLVVIPAVIAIGWWIYRGETHRFAFWKRLLLVGLRAIAVLILLGVLAEPVLVKERVQRQNSYLLVLVDDSYSMDIADRYSDPAVVERIRQSIGIAFGDQTTRMDQVVGCLSSRELDILGKLREKANVRLITFSSELQTIADLPRTDPDDPATQRTRVDLDKIVARGKVTRIGDGIYDAVSDLRGETVAGVVVFTDGRDTGGVLRPEEAAERLGRREIPVYPVGVGNAEEPKDIRVFGMDLADVVLENDKVTVDFQVVSKGFGSSVPVEVYLIAKGGGEKRREGRKFIQLEDSEEAQTHRVEFSPRYPGEYIARVEIPKQDGELFPDNNFDEKPVRVIEEKIRVLYVDGAPRYEYRYLAHALTRDPSMETQVILTSADPTYLQQVSPGLAPLHRFPDTREELFKYHLVIIGDVPPSFFSEQQKQWLIDWVDDAGGGVVFMAGIWNMPHKYRGDLLEKLFPVQLEDTERSFYNSGDLTEEFFVSVTPEGQGHDIMQLVADRTRNLDLWERHGSTLVRMPGFYWYVPVKQLKRGAIPLAVHETDRHIKYGPRPIFAFQYQGRGRTFISLTDETWRWRKGVGNKYFHKFWGQVIRFISAGRLQTNKQRFSISTDQEEYTLGQTVNVLVRVLDEKFKALQDDEYTVYHERVNPKGETVTEAIAVQNPARPEFFDTLFDANELGEHRVWITDHEEEVASATYRVLVPQLEYAEPRMDRGRLIGLAAASGGHYFDVTDVAALPDAVSAFEQEIVVPAESRPLWDTRWLMLLFVAVLSVEWIARKFFRLV